MDLGTIEITVEEAEARVAEYEKVLAADRSVEDEAILQAYRAAKRGLPVISLSKAFDIAGFNEVGLPKLAIVRSDAQQCFVEMHDLPASRGEGTRLIFGDAQWTRNLGALVGKHTVSVDTSVSRPVASRRWRASTVVPLVPPRHRPKRGRACNFHILWEVEEWTAIPADPALLRHIRGDLWSVLATWDLTELERLVLSQRRH